MILQKSRYDPRFDQTFAQSPLILVIGVLRAHFAYFPIYKRRFHHCTVG